MNKIREILKTIKKLLYCLTYKFRKPEIRVMTASLSGDGSFIDVRYRLTRPDLLSGNIPVRIVCEKTGQRFDLVRLPRFGPVRTKHAKHLFTGVLLFYNRDRKLASGSCVTLYFGALCEKNIRIK